MIETTLSDLYTAHKALRHINEEVRLPARAAYRVSRLLAKMTSQLRSYDESQVKLIVDAGGARTPMGAALNPPEKIDGESVSEFQKRLQEDARRRVELTEQLRALGLEVVKIDYDPIPLSFFDDDPNSPPEKRRVYSSNDFADLGPFISEV